ncbi:hypothetical protein BGZ90_012564 [Linnemannia elongata]|nr:hypothetical protein BGZ90_012564 [Linnemannia elongata]
MEQCNLTDRVIGLRGLVQAIIVNRITTLNLLPTHPNSLQTRDFPLREILSTFEHLLHLRAPTVVYHLEDMDLFDMRNQVLKNCRGRPESAIPSQQCRHSISEKEPAARQYIWACRGLKTLHIAIDHRYYDSNSTESSLVLFGFLTRRREAANDNDGDYYHHHQYHHPHRSQRDAFHSAKTAVVLDRDSQSRH